MDVSDTLRRMDLNLVLPLNALLEERQVTRAAESVGIGQSAMSAALGVDVQLARLGIHPNVALSTLSFTLVPWMLPGTSLFAFVHERLVNSTPVRRELKVLEPPVALKPLVETMYWHPVFHNDPAHYWLRECVTTLAANL